MRHLTACLHFPALYSLRDNLVTRANESLNMMCEVDADDKDEVVSA